MGLLVLILGLIVFLGVHTLTTQRELRAQVIAATGEAGYKIGYTIASFVGLALIIWGFGVYRATGWINVWNPPTALKHIAVALMLPAVILVVASYIRGFDWLSDEDKEKIFEGNARRLYRLDGILAQKQAAE